jgi:hypothetical protein
VGCSTNSARSRSLISDKWNTSKPLSKNKLAEQKGFTVPISSRMKNEIFSPGPEF